MPSTFDPLLRLELQEVGENPTTWGVKTNNNLSLLGAAIAGYLSINASGSGNYNLSANNAATDESRQAFLQFTGVLSGNRTIIIPSSSKIYVMRNVTTGAFTLSVKTATGNTLLLPRGESTIIACDGINVVNPVPTIPSGIITMWSGSTASIPSGWALCMTGDSEVLLADGTSRQIQEIVDDRQEVEVMAFNEKTGLLEPRKVIDWFVNDSSRDEYIRLKISRGNSKAGSKRSLDVTRDHPVWIVGKGWTKADEVVSGDKVLIHQPTVTDVGHQAILGQWLGDGSVDQRGVFSVTHGLPQKDYIADTASKFGVLVHEGVQHHSGYGAGLPTLKCKFALNTFAHSTAAMLLGGNKVRPEILADLGPVGLAYWYMDDGNLQTDPRAATPTVRAQLHTEGFCDLELETLVNWFKAAHGLTAIPFQRSNTPGKLLRFDAASTRRFLTMIAPYVHPSMRYKLPEFLRNAPYLLENASFVESKPTEQYVNTVEINKLSPSKRNSSRFHKRYDIKVDGLHSFVANGFVVHNCDGTNGTPDLRARFVIGTGTGYPVGATGGAASSTTSSAGLHTHGAVTGSTALTEAQMPAHAHGGTTTANGAHDHGMGNALAQDTSQGSLNLLSFGSGNIGVRIITNAVGDHIHAFATDVRGSGAGHNHGISGDGAHTHTVDILPPFYALAYIMKL